MKEQNTLYEHSINQQQKFIYYVIALSVAGIGFAIHQTTNQTLDWNHLLWGTSVLFWGFSIHYGFQRLMLEHSIIKSNAIYLDAKEGIFDGKQMDIGLDKIELMETDIRKMISKTGELYSRLVMFFYLGSIVFILWHIFRMFDKAISDAGAIWMPLNMLIDNSLLVINFYVVI